MEFLSYLPESQGGLFPVAVSLFHSSEAVRSRAVRLLQVRLLVIIAIPQVAMVCRCLWTVSPSLVHICISMYHAWVFIWN